MDADFLAKTQCFFGGGTQLVMSHGEFRESRDIDFLVSSPDGLRAIRETVTERSLGALSREKIHLEREVRADRDSIRTFIREDDSSPPIKFEILLEGRIELAGQHDGTLGLPILSPECAIAEKLLANADRGLAREHRSRDVIDLAFVSLVLDDSAFLSGYELAWRPYGRSIAHALEEVLKMIELDAKYRALCIEDLLIEDTKALKAGLQRLRQLKRAMAKHTPRKAG